MAKRKALGKGLSALIPDAESIQTGGGFLECPVEDIKPNPYQPRRQFDDNEMKELISSIKEKGVLTPLLVSRTTHGYMLIAGERRLRAAKQAGLKKVPVVIRESTPLESLELALIENIHRKDLNPIEEALAYKRWLEDSGTTQDQLARKLGKDRSTIANMLRLLNLPMIIQQDLIDGRLNMGHARVIAGVKDETTQRRLRNLVIKKGLSVRQLEEIIKDKIRQKKRKSKKSSPIDHYIKSLEDDLKRALGTKVELKKGKKGGKIIIHYFSDDELDRLLELLR